MHLFDCCPYGRFDGCKTDVPNICTKIHDESFPTDFKNRKDEFIYEVEAYLGLKEFMDGQDDAIKDKLKVLDKQSARFDNEERIKNEEISRVEKLISETRNHLTIYENQGNVEKAAELNQKLETFSNSLQKFQREVLDITDKREKINQMTSCGACGGLISVLNKDKRLSEHTSGKMHIGMVELREKLEELKVLALDKKNTWKGSE